MACTMERHCGYSLKWTRSPCSRGGLGAGFGSTTVSARIESGCGRMHGSAWSNDRRAKQGRGRTRSCHHCSTIGFMNSYPQFSASTKAAHWSVANCGNQQRWAARAFAFSTGGCSMYSSPSRLSDESPSMPLPCMALRMNASRYASCSGSCGGD